MKHATSSLGGIASIFIDAFLLIAMWLIVMLAYQVLRMPDLLAAQALEVSAAKEPSATDIPLVTVNINTDGIRFDGDPAIIAPSDLDSRLQALADQDGTPMICATDIPIEQIWPLKARIEAALGREALFIICTGEQS